MNLIYITFFYSRTLRRSRRRRCCWLSRGAALKNSCERTHTQNGNVAEIDEQRGGRKMKGGSGMEGRRRINANTFASKCGRPGFIYTLYCNRACCRRCCCCCCAAVALSTATTINTCSFVVGIKCLRTHTHTNTHSRTKFLMCMCYFFYFSALNLPNFHCTANNKRALSIFHKYNYYKLQINHKQTRRCSRSRVVGFVIFLLQQEDEMYVVLCCFSIVLWCGVSVFFW